MPSTNALDEARDLVKKRLVELEDERQRLERALAELGGKVTGRRPGRPKGPDARKVPDARKARRRKRRPRSQKSHPPPASPQAAPAPIRPSS